MGDLVDEERFFGLDEGDAGDDGGLVAKGGELLAEGRMNEGEEMGSERSRVDIVPEEEAMVYGDPDAFDVGENAHMGVDAGAWGRKV
jgi:hypothetical protein